MVSETMHQINKKRKGEMGEMTVKLDMSKAYDQVEWGYLQKIMLKLGFHERSVELVMLCISTISYAIRINGVPQGHITPSRGLCQGDTLSPYLFLLCVEGLAALLHQETHDKMLRGVSTYQKGPKISHLFLANDCLIFGWATIKESEKILRLLKVYGDLSS